MYAYLDVEFTDLNFPELVSVALVGSGISEFYAELPYDVENRTEYFSGHVEPHLDRNLRCESAHDLSQKIGVWFERLEQNDTLVVRYESPVHRALFESVCAEDVLWRMNFERIENGKVNDLSRSVYYRQNALVENHALNDALAFRAGVEAVLRDK
jgi:hypothetical protein